MLARPRGAIVPYGESGLMSASNTARQSAKTTSRTPLVLLDDGSPACPACGGRMWDNRATKQNPKAPDFKCRRRDCDGRVWPGQFKEQAGSPVGGEHVRESAGEQGASSASPPNDPRRAFAPEPRSLRACYLDLTAFVLREVRPKYDEAGLPCTDATAAAIVATLFIAACRRGDA